MHRITPLDHYTENDKRFTFVKDTIRDLTKVIRTKFLESDSASTSLANSRTILLGLLACLNLTLETTNLFWWQKRKIIMRNSSRKT